MDQVFYKLKNTVSSTISNTIGNTVQFSNQLSTFLPGNHVTREFEIKTDQWTSGGNVLCWRIFDGRKRSNGQDASIFVFEKKTLDRYNKKDRDLILETLRKAITQLTRLRHPNVLKVEHPLEESRDSLAFATEPVLCSLSNVLGNVENMSTPVCKEIASYEFFDVEIKYGLLQVSEGLAFLHNDVKMLFRNLCPENIIITKKGVWKLFGFEFFASPLNTGESPLKFPFMNFINQTSDYPALLLPNLDYVAPEYYEQPESVKNSKDCDRTIQLDSDMYSLGCITFTLYNQGKALLPTDQRIAALNKERITKLNGILNFSDRELRCIPEDSRYHIRQLLSTDPSMRSDANQFSKLAIFEDIQVRTLQYLDSLFQWDPLEKAKFYKGLPAVLEVMPLRVKINRVIPALAKEFHNPEMVPFVLPNYFLIVEEMEDGEFMQICLPQLGPVFQMKEPIQISMILMQKVELILKKCKRDQEMVKTQILPMVCRCFELDAVQLQEMCLHAVPTVAHLIEQSLIKNQLMPRIKRLCLQSQSLSIKINCLLCIAKILEHLDKWLVIDDVISFLPEVQSKEPAAIMAIVGIYQLAFTNSKLGLTKEILCSKVIPHLTPLSIENGLTVAQFETILGLIRSMIARVESDHKVKLEQLNSIKSQQSMTVMNFGSIQSPDTSNKSIFYGKQDEPTKSFSAISFDDSPKKNSNLSTSSILDTPALLPNESSKPALSGTSTSFQPKDLTSTLFASNLQKAPSIGSNPIHSPPSPLFKGSLSNQSNYSLSATSSMLAIEQSPSSKEIDKKNFNVLDDIPVSELMKPINIQSNQKSTTKKSLNQLGGTFQRFENVPSLSGVYSLTDNKNSAQFNKLNKSDLDEFLN